MKILVVRYGTVGDSVLASPFIRELRSAYPDAQIDILGDKVSKGVFQYCPYSDNIIEIKDKHKFFLKKYVNLFKIAKKIKGYDKIYFTKDEHFLSLAAKIAGIPNRIGINNQRSRFITTGAANDESIHIIENTLNILKSDNIPIINTNTEVWINPICEANVKNILKSLIPENKKIVVIHASTRVWQKNWIDEYWAQVLKYIDEKDDIQIVLTGAEKDIPCYKKIIRKAGPFNNEPINAAGMFSIQESMALIKTAYLVIGLESGIIHIATALNIPSIIIHGSSPLERFRPKNKNCKVASLKYECSPCIMTAKSKGIGCKGVPKCFKNLTPDLVIKEIEKCL